MASAGAIAQSIDVKSVGIHVELPQSDVAYLMYYLKCVLKGCGIDIIQDDLLDFENYYRLSSQRQDQVFLAAYTYSPDELIHKTIIYDNDGSICGTELNIFLRISEDTRILHAQEEVLIVGERKRIASIMVFRKNWLDKFYMEPIQRNIQRLKRAMIATVTKHCEHCAGRSGKCVCDRCPRTMESKCSRTASLWLMSAISDALDDVGKASSEAGEGHCIHCKGLEANCRCQEGCDKPEKARCITVHKGILCNECGQDSIVGVRYKCAECIACNLCETCYTNKKHEVSHKFHMIERVGGKWNSLEPRLVAETKQEIGSKGFFYETMSIAEMKAYLVENGESSDGVFEKQDLQRKVWECYCDSISAKELAQVILDNRIDVSGCRDIRSRREATKRAFHAKRQLSAPGTSQEKFSKGQLVRLHGLKSAIDLNGKAGHVVNPCAMPGRAEIALGENDRKLIRYENLEVVAELVD